jgi:demethylmenaquinone methyltransferase/2-methoxy-6-polyprenyl-1,4-benzoquinol methylase
LYGWYFRRILPRIGQSLAPNGASAYDYLPQSVGEFPSYEALAERMERAGLSDVHFTPLSFGVATLYIGTKPMPILPDDSAAYLSSEPIPPPEAAVR